jgi:hypothetical protein
MERRGEGWILFAAIVLGVAGIMRIFDAIWAFRYHGVLPENFEAAIFGHRGTASRPTAGSTSSWPPY